METVSSSSPRKDNSNNNKVNYCTNLSSYVSNAIGNLFYKIGFKVASNPWNTIIISLLIVVTCSVGFIKFHIEKNPLELWLPKNSEFLKTTKWLIDNIHYGFRLQSVLLVAPNVLEPYVLRKALKIHGKIEKMSAKLPNGTKIKWNDVCLKIPFISDAISIPPSTSINDDNYGDEIKKRKKRYTKSSYTNNNDDNVFSELFQEVDEIRQKPAREFNPSIDINPVVYCRFINSMPRGCYERNLLELWKYNDSIIENLTKYEILKTLNKTKISPWTGHETDFTELLGDIKRDSNGKIISAGALLIQWFVMLNFSEIDFKATGNLAGTEDWITIETASWENAFLMHLESLKNELDDLSVKIYYSAAKSFGDISHSTMFKETNKLGLGITLMFIYIQIVLSKYSWIELRLGLGGLGLLSVGLAFVSACGICAALGISYGPVHTSLPFLLMGLGVDDMFVMMACWQRVKNEKVSIEEKIGRMLKHAGASITVTSFTDIIAFLVGSLTVIPSLQSFCLYASIGVFMTYIFAITYFIAIFALDERRINAKRNTLLPCIKHTNDKYTKLWFDLNLMQRSLKTIYSKFIFTKPGKIIVLFTVIGLSSISTVNLFKLEQKFDPNWFIPESTYLHKYIKNLRIYFPEAGYQGTIFMGALNYTDSLPEISHFVTEIESKNEYLYNVNSWVKPFRDFVSVYYHKDILKQKLTDFELRHYLSKFLFSRNGGKFQANFRFNGTLKCGEITPPITVSWIDFRFKKFRHRSEYLPAMYEIQNIVKHYNFTESGDGFTSVWARTFANWLVDEIIDTEIFRNITLALICVMVCTVVIIVDVQICFWIFVSVLLTLVNVCGFMQLWGLTIDLVSCIGLQLAVGLCVDYATHIGHTFLVCSNGDRNKRALDTILRIGGAVLYGGGSTLLSLLLLSRSEAYTFQAFFKIFFLVISFGLFHGVVLLPVILSLIGPSPYINKTINEKEYQFDGEEMQPINNINKAQIEHNAQNNDNANENNCNDENEKMNKF